MSDQPTNQPTNQPEMYHYRDMKTMPRGIEMKEFVRTDGTITFSGQYINQKNHQPCHRPKRIYRVEVRGVEVFNGIVSEWQAAVWEDDSNLVALWGRSKWLVAYAALGALRGILHKRCVSTGGNRRRRRAANNKSHDAKSKEASVSDA